MRTLGVEEEFLIVDPHSGRPVPLGSQLLAVRSRGAASTSSLTAELQTEQIEAVSQICSSLDELECAIHDGRAQADRAAQLVGARIAALGTSPLQTAPHLSPAGRYQEIGDRFGLTAREQLTCGFHVHVAIESAEEGVAILDRIGAWLPVLLALSVNSPYWNGNSTGHASFRRQVLARLPLTGATDRFGCADAYFERIESYVSTGVVLDPNMVYFDARLSPQHPTVEIRVADTCLHAETALLIAGLARALVETAVTEWRDGTPPMPIVAELNNLAMWRAGRDGLDGDLILPGIWRPRPARAVLACFMERLESALRRLGDFSRIRELLNWQLGHGCGASFQRRLAADSVDLAPVVIEAVRRTVPERPYNCNATARR